MTNTDEAVKTAAIGIGGTLASIGLSQWESIAAISAGFATAIYLLAKTWQALRRK